MIKVNNSITSDRECTSYCVIVCMPERECVFLVMCFGLISNKVPKLPSLKHGALISSDPLFLLLSTRTFFHLFPFSSFVLSGKTDLNQLCQPIELFIFLKEMPIQVCRLYKGLSLNIVVISGWPLEVRCSCTNKFKRKIAKKNCL